ncbi:hypothetical protein [Serratia sp. M24T3]|uniref:hypothetical protein n=1 Tax=Serratia sp. M24T3 TaxID=932213 RepID=UPI00025BB246|nr:hypothetical protein [Serratia sp. M24T3]EIC82901.1 hypothetical protein SPM24T3_19490 [Serratia sp. M24T3]
MAKTVAIKRAPSKTLFSEICSLAFLLTGSSAIRSLQHINDSRTNFPWLAARIIILQQIASVIGVKWIRVGSQKKISYLLL